MSLPIVKDFFSNKVTIQLKSGQKFQGLLSQVDYKKQTITLEDVEDLGNSNDKTFIPHDKKIAQKIFEHEQISQILFKEKHFSEPKKYKQAQFWDAISEPIAQKKYKQKNYQQRQRGQNYRGGNRGRGGYYQKNYGDRDNRDRRDNRDNREHKDNRDNNRNYDKKSYNEREGENKEKRQNNDERDYR